MSMEEPALLEWGAVVQHEPPPPLLLHLLLGHAQPPDLELPPRASSDPCDCTQGSHQLTPPAHDPNFHSVLYFLLKYGLTPKGHQAVLGNSGIEERDLQKIKHTPTTITKGPQRKTMRAEKRTQWNYS